MGATGHLDMPAIRRAQEQTTRLAGLVREELAGDLLLLVRVADAALGLYAETAPQPEAASGAAEDEYLDGVFGL